MHFSKALTKGKLIKRYKRFLADVELADKSIVTAHCPNTGSMESCYSEGCIVWLSPSENPDRKLKWTWEFTETENGLIGVNTSRPNQVGAEAVQEGLLSTLSGYSSIKREVKYGKNSRIDLLLEDPKKKSCYVEIKNTTLKRGDEIMFPDAVTERGLKHLEELTEMVKQGHRAVMLYFVNRPDGSYFTPAESIDKAYAQGLRRAVTEGVEIIAARVHSTPTEMKITGTIPVQL